MATSPNYGWLEPDNTDLVKNGALAIRTLGNAIDTTMATMTPKSIVDAKGDLIAASAADTPARLAAGANGETLVADSSTSTGLRYQPTMAGGKNVVINGGFDIWQRGTSFTTLQNYIADRWFWGGAGTGRTISRQTGTAGCQYAIRMQRDSGNTSTNSIAIGSSMEIAQATPLQGNTITLSFYAKAGANYSATSNLLTVQLSTGTSSTEANRMTTAYASGDATPLNSTATLTTSWQRFSYNVTLASNVTQFFVYLQSGCVGTAGAADYVDITGVQVEVGSVATQFTRATGTIQGELAACQRYYYRTVADNAYTQFGNGSAKISTQAQVMVPFPVVMRVAPTALTYGSLVLFDGSSIVNAGTVTLNYNGRSLGAIDCATTGLTQFRPYFLLSDNTTAGFVAFSAEL